MRSSSPRFSRPLASGRPSLRREESVASTASAPGELEFTEWLARMDQMKAGSQDGRGTDRGSKGSRNDSDKDDKKKKRRSFLNLLVR